MLILFFSLRHTHSLNAILAIHTLLNTLSIHFLLVLGDLFKLFFRDVADSDRLRDWLFWPGQSAVLFCGRHFGLPFQPQVLQLCRHPLQLSRHRVLRSFQRRYKTEWGSPLIFLQKPFFVLLTFVHVVFRNRYVVVLRNRYTVRFMFMNKNGIWRGNGWRTNDKTNGYVFVARIFQSL